MLWLQLYDVIAAKADWRRKKPCLGSNYSILKLHSGLKSCQLVGLYGYQLRYFVMLFFQHKNAARSVFICTYVFIKL